MTNPTPPATNRVYFFLVLTTFFWGGSFLFTKIGIATIPPQLFVLTRFILATTIMLAVCSRRLSRLDRGTLIRGMTVGIALGLTNLSFVFGIQGTSISRAGILNNLFVLFIPVITKIFWRDRIGRVNMAGIALAVTGIVLLATGGGGGFMRARAPTGRMRGHVEYGPARPASGGVIRCTSTLRWVAWRGIAWVGQDAALIDRACRRVWPMARGPAARRPFARQ